MIDDIKTLFRPAFHSARQLRARVPAGRLVAHDDPSIRAVGLALSETLTGSVPPDEQRVLDTIEERRRDMLESHELIEFIDFGAGSSKSNRTQDQMQAGVASVVTIAEACGYSKPQFWAIFLHRLTRHLQPTSAVELGTCVGISASYQGAAMKSNGHGQLVTLEGSPAVAAVARDTLNLIDATNVTVVTGPFHHTLVDVLENAAPVDYLFNDGHHDHDAVIRYLEDAVPYLSDDAVVVFDDISWSPGMRRAWEETENDPRVRATIDLGAMGIAVMGTPTVDRPRFRIPL